MARGSKIPKAHSTPANSDLTTSRKQEHLDICRDQNVASLSLAGWDEIRLPHRALPEIDFSEVSTDIKFLGNKLTSPFLISSMTGGSAEGERVNSLLAEFASDRGIAMGVGSQRVALENRDSKLFALRKVAPQATLFANIGVVQFNYGVGVEDCQWIVDQLQAQALILHVNPLQEAIQSEGDRNFSALFKKISTLRKKIKTPIILKETGCGLDAITCKRAVECGVDALDIAGLGGTHWGFIEGLRNSERFELGSLFRDWGIPTPQALIQARKAVGWNFPIIASGGVRQGLDAARALWLGADLVGMALPFLKVAGQGRVGLDAFLDQQIEALKISLFCTGQKTCKELKAL